MCNAFNHPHRCRCGFGGEGHLGRSGAHAMRSRHESGHSGAGRRRWTSGSMSQLAVELGRSLLFPVRCRYCGVQIFLFADPDGGFAVFNQVGKPWPKHSCGGRFHAPSSYYDPETPCFAQYELPVPSDTSFAPYNPGKVLIGTVVHIAREDIPRAGKLFRVVLYDGRALFSILSTKKFRIGVVIRGVAQSILGIGCCLAEVERIDAGFRKRPSRKATANPSASRKVLPKVRERKRAQPASSGQNRSRRNHGNDSTQRRRQTTNQG
jgi:hypothetical protein